MKSGVSSYCFNPLFTENRISMMEAITNRGNGNYAYIDSLHEARKVLVEQAAGTFVTIAKDVKIVNTGYGEMSSLFQDNVVQSATVIGSIPHPVIDEILSVALCEDERIIVGSPKEKVIACSAANNVAAFVTEKIVVASVT